MWSFHAGLTDLFWHLIIATVTVMSEDPRCSVFELNAEDLTWHPEYTVWWP